MQSVPLEAIRDKLRLVLPAPALPPQAGAEPSPPEFGEDRPELFSGVRAYARRWLAAGGVSSVTSYRLLSLIRNLSAQLAYGDTLTDKSAGAGALPSAATSSSVTILLDDASALAAICAAAPGEASGGLMLVRGLVSLASFADAAAAGMTASVPRTHSEAVSGSAYVLPITGSGAPAAVAWDAVSAGAASADALSGLGLGLASARSSGASASASASDADSGASLRIPHLSGGLPAPSAAAGALSARRASISSSSSSGAGTPAVAGPHEGSASPALAFTETAVPASARSSSKPSPSAGLRSSRGSGTTAQLSHAASAASGPASRSRPGSARASPAASASPPKPPAHARVSSGGSVGSAAAACQRHAQVGYSASHGAACRPTGLSFPGAATVPIRCVIRLPMEADVAIGDGAGGFCRVALLRYLQSLCDAVAAFTSLPSGHSKDVHGRVTVSRRPVVYTYLADASSSGGPGGTFAGMLPVAALPAALSAPGALATHAWAVAPPLSSLYRIADSSCRLQSVGECSFV